MEETTTLGASRFLRSGSAYLLVVTPTSRSRFALDDPAVVVVGRAQEANLRIDHSSVSRQHARICVEHGEIRLADLGSHNGTVVNGQRLSEPHVLASGDVVAIGEALLILHGEFAPPRPHVLLDERSWRLRLAEEVERAVAFRRSLAVVAVTDVHAAASTIVETLRTIDVLGRFDDRSVFALLPEADEVIAGQLADQLARVVGRAQPAVRVGVALLPSDASDVESLILAARAAAQAASPGTTATVADSVQRRSLGDRTVLLCHPAMLRVFDLLQRLAASELPVLIIGETGVGKENAAYAVHHHSARRAQPFVALNCAAIPEGLVESQLFGHAKGAFTGAIAARPGVFETASGGTLFLDELGELAPQVQATLLRALETKRVVRVGETHEREVDVRIVAATNRDVEREIEIGRFRADLYFRLGAARVHLPPLRERRCEIPILFRELLGSAARQAGRALPMPSADVVQQLLVHGWPGNVRELKHVAEYVVATVDGDRIQVEDLPESLLTAAQVKPVTVAQSPPVSGTPMRRLADELEELECRRMIEALAKSGGIKTRAAALLGMPIRTFNSKFREYGL